MFKFNFVLENTEPENNASLAAVEILECVEASKWLPAKDHVPVHRHLQAIDNNTLATEVTIGKTKLHYICEESIVKNMESQGCSDSVNQAIRGCSDLISSVYEGGLKIWECTWDLLQYIDDNQIDFNGARVLELGCGMALPAIYAMMKGASIVVQDYNPDVIECLTIPNVLLNMDVELTQSGCGKSQVLEVVGRRCRFYSGDWHFLSSALLTATVDGDPITENNKFDWILTSETIYNVECYEKLLDVMTKCLKKSGTILLAAKSHYFGVGGSTSQFINFVEKKDLFQVIENTVNQEGLKRQILELRFK